MLKTDTKFKWTQRNKKINENTAIHVWQLSSLSVVFFKELHSLMTFWIKFFWPQPWTRIPAPLELAAFSFSYCQLLMLSWIHLRSFRSVIKLYFPPLVKHSSISRSCVVFASLRIRRWEVRLFRGPAVAPAVLQVFALLRVAGGLWLLPWPRPDSVYRLQQWRLTAKTNYTCRHQTLLTPADKHLNLSLTHEHCSITNSFTV